MPHRHRVFVSTLALALLAAGASRAGTVTFSEASNGFQPLDWLRATMSYSLPDPLTLELSIRNDTTAAAPFDITNIFFNGGSQVYYLELVSASSSVSGDNTAGWRLGYYGYDLVTPTFGTFDYSLRTSPFAAGEHRIAPGETQHFQLTVLCNTYLGCTEDLLDGWSESRGVSASAALFFEYGPEGRSGFGALLTPIPEPRGAALLGIGLAALSAARARRRGARGRGGPRSPRAA